MAKLYTFAAQDKSDELPEIPKAVTVYGETLRDATQKLGKVLKEDPKLENPHPELREGETKESKPSSKREKGDK